jgi:hypothetical protein
MHNKLFVALVFLLLGCTKSDPEYTLADNKWNLISLSGFRMPSIDIKKGDIIWSFSGDSILKVENKVNVGFPLSGSYTIQSKLTPEGKILFKDEVFFANVIVEKSDTLVLVNHPESCGPGWTLVK